jgi:hypothetical protein
LKTAFLAVAVCKIQPKEANFRDYRIVRNRKNLEGALVQGFRNGISPFLIPEEIYETGILSFLFRKAFTEQEFFNFYSRGRLRRENAPNFVRDADSDSNAVGFLT